MQLVNEILLVQELEVLASGLSDDSIEVLAFILFSFSVLEGSMVYAFCFFSRKS